MRASCMKRDVGKGRGVMGKGKGGKKAGAAEEFSLSNSDLNGILSPLLVGFTVRRGNALTRLIEV